MGRYEVHTGSILGPCEAMRGHAWPYGPPSWRRHMDHIPWHRWSFHGPVVAFVSMQHAWCRCDPLCDHDIPLVPEVNSLQVIGTSAHPPGTGMDHPGLVQWFRNFVAVPLHFRYRVPGTPRYLVLEPPPIPQADGLQWIRLVIERGIRDIQLWAGQHQAQ